MASSSTRARLRRRSTPAVLLVVLAVAIGLGAVSNEIRTVAASREAARPTISLPIRDGAHLVFTGRVRARAVARLQVRSEKRWKEAARKRASRSGQYVVTTVLPGADRRYRVVADGRASVVRRFARPLAAPASDDGPAGVAPPAVVPPPGAPHDPEIQEPAAPLDPPAAEDRPGGPVEGPPAKEPPAVEEPEGEVPPEEPPAPEEPATDDCGVRPQKPEGGLWSCTFVDEFGGTSLDGSKWMPQTTWLSGMVGGELGCYVNTPTTISVRDGLLRLTSLRNLPEFTCVSPYGSFQSRAVVATVASKARFTQVRGRFEARMRMPAERAIPGSHSAFWLYPDQHTYGVWPGSGEIDVAEWFSARPANVYPSVHYAGEVGSSGANCPVPTSSSAFHTYAVEWTPTVMRFYYDDSLCFSHRWTPSNVTPPKPFDQPFYLVLTQVWGAAWNSPVAAMANSSTLVVDWVRAWQ